MAALNIGVVVIDTAPPSVVSAISRRGSGQIAIVFKDNVSGLDRTTVANAANYALIGPHGLRVHPSSATIVPSATVVPSDPITVILVFNGVTIHGVRKLALGNIADLAGNPRAHEILNVYPTGHGKTGTNTSSRIAARSHHAKRRS
jgi:hypothetical protein